MIERSFSQAHEMAWLEKARRWRRMSEAALASEKEVYGRAFQAFAPRWFVEEFDLMKEST